MSIKMKKLLVGLLVSLPLFSFASFNYDKYVNSIINLSDNKNGNLVQITVSSGSLSNGTNIKLHFSGSDNKYFQNKANQFVKKFNKLSNLKKQEIVKRLQAKANVKISAKWGSGSNIMPASNSSKGTGLVSNVPKYNYSKPKNTNQNISKPTTSKPVSTDLQDINNVRNQMLDLINLEREKSGLNKLVLNDKLNVIAQDYASEMKNTGYFSHVSKTGVTPSQRAQSGGYNYRSLGENIAMGQKSIVDVMKAWMNSPGHRENILSPNYKEVGIGFDNYYWVQDFGSTFK